MGKRLVIKTALICLGIFLIINTLLISYFLTKYPLDLEEYMEAVVAAKDIAAGTTIEEGHLTVKRIQSRTANHLFIKDFGQAVGKRAAMDIAAGDYIRTTVVIDKKERNNDDERIIVLPVDMEGRLANLIKKGSFIDIRVREELQDRVETILKEVRVQDVLDESGTPFGTAAAVNSQKAYLKLILDENERQQVYGAAGRGKLFFELYCE